MLDELYVEGLVHVTGLPKDYYFHEQAHHRMVGERTGRVFRLGDKLNVRVVRVDLDERKIDFELLETQGSKKKTKVSPQAKKLADEYEQKRQAKSKRNRKQNNGGEPSKKKRGPGARKSKPGNKTDGKKSTANKGARSKRRH